MIEFENIFANNEVTLELKNRLSEFYNSVIQRPINLIDLKSKMLLLFEYLSSEEGRTDQNCKAVNSFIMLSERWDQDYLDLPEKYHDIISVAGECLHDTITSPEIAENFGGTPEQLLGSCREL